MRSGEMFQMGDLAFVDSVDITSGRHGSNSAMRRMIGTEADVIQVEGRKITLKDVKRGATWMFAVEDLSIPVSINEVVSEAMAGDPIMFDPKELI